MDFLISLKVVLDSSKIKVSWLHLVLVDYRSNLVSQLRQVSETHLPLKVLGVLADFQLQINNSSNLILVLLNYQTLVTSKILNPVNLETLHNLVLELSTVMTLSKDILSRLTA